MQTQRNLFAAIAALSFLAPTTQADVIEVDQVMMTFVPSHVVIREGDTIRWNWSMGFHSILPGTDGTVDRDEAWSGVIDSANPTLEITFDAATIAAMDANGDNANATGLYDYFCVEHFTMGMLGTIQIVEDSVGTNYCSASDNSSGGSALMTASGSTSIADDDLTLIAGPLPAASGYVFFAGPNQLATPFGNGVRCVGGPIRRLAVGSSLDSQAFASLSPIAEGLAPGTLNVQCWYRDVSAGGAQFDLSNGLELTLLP